MADLSDVMTEFKTLILGVLYPTGQQTPFQVSSIGVFVRVMTGWVIEPQLSLDLKAGYCEVSIYARPEETNETRFQKTWVELSRVPATVTAAVAGNAVTLGGVVAAGQTLALLVNYKSYNVNALSTDTASTLAAALAALISADTPATAAGPVITIPAAFSIIARPGGSATIAQEVGRQRKTFQIVMWAPTPALRDTLAKAINPALRVLDWLSFPDGSTGRIRYQSSILLDTAERAETYRRDLFYTVEYPDIVTETAYVITTPEVVLETDLVGNGGQVPIGHPVTIVL